MAKMSDATVDTGVVGECEYKFLAMGNENQIYISPQKAHSTKHAHTHTNMYFLFA